MSYGLLSDICHPSVGANLLAWLSEPADDRSIVQPVVSESLVNWYWREVVAPVVQPVAAVAREALKEIDQIASGFTCRPETGNAAEDTGDAR